MESGMSIPLQEDEKMESGKGIHKQVLSSAVPEERCSTSEMRSYAQVSGELHCMLCDAIYFTSKRYIGYLNQCVGNKSASRLCCWLPQCSANFNLYQE